MPFRKGIVLLIEYLQEKELVQNSKIMSGDLTTQENDNYNSKLLRLVTANITTALFMMDASGRVTYMNSAAEKITGYKQEELVGEVLHTKLHHHYPNGDPFPISACPISLHVLQNNIPLRQHEDTFIRKDGSFFPVLVSSIPFTDEGEVKQVVLEVLDLTENKKAAKALEESRIRLNFALKASGAIGLWDWDCVEDKVYSDEKFGAFFSISAEDSVKGVPLKRYTGVIHPDDVDEVKKSIESTLFNSEPYSCEYRIRQSDGTYKWILAYGHCQTDNVSGKPLRFTGFGVDITQRKETELALKESEERFRALADSMPQMIWSTQPDGFHDYYNQKWFDFVGKEMQETEGDGWNAQFHPEDQERAREVWAHSLKTGEPYEIEYRLRRHDGVYHWVLGRALPIKNEQGQIIRWFGTCTDIQQQKETEKELIHANETLTKVNSDLDNFIYTASHDLKAPISNIEGLVNMLGETINLKADGAEQEIISLINSSIQKFKQTLNDLTEISKVQKHVDGAKTEISFKEVMDESLGSVANLIRSTGAVIYSDFGVESVYFSRKNLRSILYNLLSNAIKYSHPERIPEVRLETRREEGYIVLKVADNGLGIDPAKHDNLFKMFRRLHNHVEGSGIGLYIIKRIMDNEKGKVEVESEPGKGTIFKVFFRAASSS